MKTQKINTVLSKLTIQHFSFCCSTKNKRYKTTDFNHLIINARSRTLITQLPLKSHLWHRWEQLSDCDSKLPGLYRPLSRDPGTQQGAESVRCGEAARELEGRATGCHAQCGRDRVLPRLPRGPEYFRAPFLELPSESAQFPGEYAQGWYILNSQTPVCRRRKGLQTAPRASAPFTNKEAAVG